MNESPPRPHRTSLRPWIYDILLVYVLLAGAYLRFSGLFWGEYQYLHPDERFLVWVGTDISPVNSLAEYWDTAHSSLNPHNRGHGFYVYGTLPMFLTRYVVEGLSGHSGFDVMTNVGRALSALFDLGTVMLVYLVATRLYDRRVGILAAAFSAVAVCQIQQSHFFTMDTFVTFFAMLTVYFAVRVMSELRHLPSAIRHPLTLLSVGFGVALGMSVASKVSTGLLAFLLPAAMIVGLGGLPSEAQKRRILYLLGYLTLAAVVSLLVFRVLQPYAFSGPGFFGLKPNPAWLDDLKDLRNQTTGDVDFPPAIQWARRPVWFAWINMVLWGMGLPLGLLAWAGFLWIGWRIFKRREWRPHLMLWGWTAVFFVYWSLPFNPMMRYQLPVYPTLVIFAAWAVVQLWDRHKAHSPTLRSSLFRRGIALALGLAVLLAATLYAFAFTSIYTRPITRVEASRWVYQNIPAPINLLLQTQEGGYNQPIPFPEGFAIQPVAPFITAFTARASGTLREIDLAHAVDLQANHAEKTLTLTLSAHPDFSDPLATSRLTADFATASDGRGVSYRLPLDRPVSLSKGETYYLQLALESGKGNIALQGTTLAVEGAWDDSLPVRLDGYDGYGGIYRGLAFDMYEDDNPGKFARFLSILDQADYILISSSRQWGSLPRIPERYPMSTAYYRSLLGCPAERSIEWCYSVAQPGQFQGELGFELVKVFQSDPALGPLRLNDQFAEEAFTVYDHPKVLIFAKRPDYDARSVRALLGRVDLSKVVHLSPRKATSWVDRLLPVNLVKIERNALMRGASPAQKMMLSAEQQAIQSAGGAWSSLFDTQAWHNRWPALGLLLWYLALTLLGWIVYPILRLALSGLPDHGYPLARIAALLLLSYLAWLAGSLGIPFTRLTISLLVGLLVIVAAVLAYFQRAGLRREWQERRRYFLLIEGLFLAFFVFDLIIRLGNPDLWHPWKGGEKPMDFSYFNAILKSTTFPPYDPWFAGGYINYYYYGFVLVGVLVKWLGIVPSIAYNLILPTVFALIALGAFSIGWNLVVGKRGERGRGLPRLALIGLAAALGMAVLGNLGTVRMVYQGYQRLVAADGNIADVSVPTHLVWAFRGAMRTLTGTPLPYSLADWYWNPSRAIPAPGEVEPITEFPFFTVLYGDPHAHLFALPLSLLALGWILSVVFADDSQHSKIWKGLCIGLSFLVGGLTIGALRPTNTWDLPTYLALGSVALGYAVWKADSRRRKEKPSAPSVLYPLLRALGGVILLTGLAFLLYQPYARWYVPGYTKVEMWKGTHTPFWSYLTHWGLFLFVIVSWMAWETRDWMANTPLFALRKLMPYRPAIVGTLLLLLAWVVALLTLGVHIAWLVLPLAAWAGVLIFRPGMSDAKRVVLFLFGTGLVLTLLVEVVVLHGDIGRMNTVFKFYLQVWTLFAISTAATLSWLWEALPVWTTAWRRVWSVALAVLVAAAALYPLMAGIAKIKDRMETSAPHTLDGMAFMQYAAYPDLNTTLDLSQDYRAIRWMQENVIGSPVIVEANMVEYHWGSRFTIYTGLPGVVGWNWHQRQQRAQMSEVVQARVNAVGEFYRTTDVQRAQIFLDAYDVRYIILGQLERAEYPSPGLEKFEQYNGELWNAVYRDGETVIYLVNR